MDKLQNAVQRINDALCQGRRLEIKFSFADDISGPVIDVEVDDHTYSTVRHVFSDLNFTSFEEAVIAVGEAI